MRPAQHWTIDASEEYSDASEEYSDASEEYSTRVPPSMRTRMKLTTPEFASVRPWAELAPHVLEARSCSVD